MSPKSYSVHKYHSKSHEILSPFYTHLVAYVVTCYHDNSLAISFAHFHLFYERVYDKRTGDFFPYSYLLTHLESCYLTMTLDFLVLNWEN